MRGSVAFIVAPYGFGPSSKAVAISSYLPRSIERVCLSQGPPLEMARRSEEFSNCAALDFRNGLASAAERLAAHDVLVFVNSTRFITSPLIADRPSILVETLAWLREEPPACASMLRAFYAQRFFDQGFSPELEAMDNFCAVGPIVPRSIANARRRVTKPLKSPIVHCGGLFSPAMMEGAGDEFVAHTLDVLTQIGGPVRMIVPTHIFDRVRSRAGDQVAVLDCSPLSIHEHLAGSEFALTTTGIEFTYECMLLAVPALFLPPFNASQQFQLDYHRSACAESVPFGSNIRIPTDFAGLHEATASVQQQGMAGCWGAQFADVSRVLGHLGADERGLLLRRIGESQRRLIQDAGVDSAQGIASRILLDVGSEVVPQ